MIDFRKDFLPQIASPDLSTPPISGSQHKDRVLLKSVKARSLLLKYSGCTKDRKHLKNHKELSRSEFRELTHLTRIDFPNLSSFLTKLSTQTGEFRSPTQYRDFFSELARNGPACGIFQIRGN